MAPSYQRRRNSQNRGRSRTPQTQPEVPESQSRADAQRAASEAMEVARQHQREAARLQTIAESFAPQDAGAGEASGSHANQGGGRAGSARSNSRQSTSVARRRNRSNYRNNRNSAVIKTPVLRRRVTEVTRLDVTNTRDGTTTMEVVNISLNGGITTNFEGPTHSEGVLGRTTDIAAITAAAHQVQNETGAREFSYHIEPVLNNRQRFLDANIMSVRNTTNHGRVRHAQVAAFQQPRVADVSREPDTPRCVNCDSKSHALKDCLRAYKGYIFACILCQKRDHLTDRCDRFTTLTVKEKFKVLVLDRANKPPLGVKDEALEWWTVLSDFVGSDQHSPDEQFVGFPWSPKYAEDLTWEDDGEYAIGLQRQYDVAFDASLLPVQFPANNIQAVWNRFWPRSPSRHEHLDDSAPPPNGNMSSTQRNDAGPNAGVELFPPGTLQRFRERRNRTWNSGNQEFGVHDD
ncbi:hypothetical protein BFJ72_g2592 [Fusarium proliferatum]|uniref:CCHC-type domain-containing protein n=1 Tax=Gibberella intermedia TaxID=948311 RepID=A0A420TZB9_GIBIN|nr:hypothetical protein BFJ72_g2592 [Fusarium proliferatum]